MRVHVDQDRCCGSGMCVLSAPSVFDQRDEDGIVVLLDPEPPAEVLADVRDAVAGCPALAIELAGDEERAE
ncbi:ferredoxin [Actinacidiphila guanduensis]|uniref:Ferredoxin n=1 Tax=Actinacidiphila guanduensis TaxID=310781 RepID=A0A1H0HPG5_9ACTN|nr:ferredoxin [Actinacidiphila guanduensis]SDO21076.1 Ferredoxin [Actinacidiphila guanduensis]